MQLLDQAYNRDAYLDFLANKFQFNKLIPITSDVKSFQRLGTVTTQDDKTLPVFEIHIKSNTKLERNRVGLRNLVAKQIKSEDGALAVYIDENKGQWRFSFIAIEYGFDESGLTKTQTASKRFTYLLGKDVKTRTAKKRFNILNKQSNLADLKTAFSVEQLNKEFYDALYKWYDNAKNEVVFPNDENAQSHIEASLIRFLTRILFVWFLKEKHLINPDLFDLEKLKNLIDYDKDSSFYKAILQNLFFATLNRRIKDRDFRRTTSGKPNNTNYLATNIYRYQEYFQNNDEQKIMNLFKQTPFLNGGLFECLDHEASDDEKLDYDKNKDIRKVRSAIRIDGFSDNDKNELVFTNEHFFNAEETGLCDLFNQYQFTIEESTPLDIEVALDPELLGKVFENLLATYNPETGKQAQKATGSFYTPREIVDYMVDESLKQHFKTHTDLSESQINDCFIEGKTKLKEAQIKTVIETIDSLKILDPAVGSGAYPMGILQRLVFILDKIDHENTHFKQQQLDKAEQMEGASKKASIEVIEQVFSKDNQHNAYGKKLMLIENSIYGVDIQPIAIQICKLRFFISLAIEHKPNQDANDNYGIKALPNLETKFIVANTLLPLGKIEVELGQTLGMFDTGIKDLQDNLAEVRHQYFTAKTLKTKRKYRNEDKDLREKMKSRLKQSGITPEVEASIQKVVDWDLYNQNSVSDWFDPEWMFGVKDGFDIVLGNPPYIRQEKIKQWKKQFEQSYQVFTGTADIYTYFYEKGFHLLNENGHLCYITSNKWMRAKYGEKLRYFFKETTHLKQIIDFEGEQIFENATVDTNILLCGKHAQAPDESFHYQKQLPDEENPLFTMAIADLSSNAYTLQAPEILALKKKIETIGTPLKDWDINIYRGVLTGFNEAFIIDTAKRDELIAQDPKSAEIIKPILRGRDIKAYEHHWVGLWIIATFPVLKIDIDYYPAIKNHLLDFGKDRLEQAGKKLPDGTKSRKKTGNKWFETQDQIGYHAEFEKEKIVYSEIVQKPQFYLDKDNHYIEATAFIMSGSSLKFLVALLHSQLITYTFKMFYAGGGLGEKGYRYKKVFLEQLPIPQISATEQQPFIDLVDKILTAKKDDKDTTALEAQIDKMVYRLYNLSPAEIKIIEAEK
ncbi:putative type IIS restriction/modification enzyme [uncultured Candidatus Thioglobus sp.]|nr:putative type IIS restriction/modification enzyme [uncultured Candidatus Thioglobus sp.]